MENKTFLIKEAIDWGFKTTSKKFKLLFFAMVIYLLTVVLVGLANALIIIFISNFYKENVALFIFARVLAYLGSSIMNGILLLGYLRIGLDLHDYGSSNLKQLFLSYHVLISYLVAGFLFGLLTMFGFILFIIPGIIWGIKYSFFDLIIIDTQCGPLEALKKSALLTQGAKWPLFLFFLASVGIVLVSILIIIGPLFTVPAVFLARIFIYRKLLAAQQKQQVA